MMKYEIETEIYKGSHSIVYNGKSVSDGKRVIIKALRREAISAESMESFRREFEITKELESATEVVSAYDIETFESSLAIVLEDFGAKSLSHLLSETSFSIEETLKIGIQIAGALEKIHGNHLMHKDINPNNIVYNPHTFTAKIIDFGIASKVNRETASVEISHLLGTLPYISPEQTGRMNRLVDYRTDLYSLGATLYELLCGQPPFEANDPLEIVHCHIARVPERVDKINSEVPTVLADIVAKLLSKAAEDRYQSATGVKADLRYCLNQVQNKRPLTPFKLAQKDVCDRLILGQKLYGREKETKRLFEGFDRARRGESGLFLISGQSGVGKTALVNEVLRPMTQHRGFFISSKFDQFNRNTPYMAIVNAFSELSRQLLTEDDSQIRTWKQRLKSALGKNGGIITETIPEMALVMGPQPTPEALPPTETKNRFNVVFQKFTGVLATSDHPIVLFLDDLQWADMASLEIIEQLVTSDEQNALYIIGAYRHNQVDSSHPLGALIDKMKALGVSIEEAFLHPLQLSDVSLLVSDTLSSSVQDTSEFTGLVYEKTGGNPFFVGQLLESFHAENLLSFCADELKWTWNLAAIKSYGYSENVIDLLVPKVAKLSKDSQETLRLASCIGTVFDTKLLSALLPRAKNSGSVCLEEATQAGLVERLPTIASLAQHTSRDIAPLQYRFVHDRILQAIYTNISHKEKLEIHHRIGQVLLQKTSADNEEQHLFQTVLHLNISRSLIETEKERNRLAELNLAAGKKAKLSAANESALEYFEIGISLLGPNIWEADYSLCLALHEEAAEAAHLSTDSPKVKALAEEIFERARDVLDKVKAAEVRIFSLFAMDRNLELLQFGTRFLADLGLRIPLNPSKLNVVLALMRAKKSLAGKTDEHLLSLPPMSDKKVLAAMRILSAMSLAAFSSSRNLYAMFILTQVRLISHYGHSVYSSNTYGSYGLILSGKLGDMDGGYRFGKLSLKLLETYFDRSLVCRAKTLSNVFLFPWKEHMLNTGNELLNSYLEGIDSGNFQYGSTAIGFYINCIIFGGYKNLGALSEDALIYLRAVKNKKQSFWVNFIRLNRNLVFNFRNDVPNPLVLDGDDATEQELLAEAIREKNGMAQWCVWAAKTFIAIHFGMFEQGVDIVEQARALKEHHSETSHPSCAYVHLGEAIIYLRATSNWRSPEGRRRRRLIKQILKFLEKVSTHGPMNYLYMVTLLRAEIYRMKLQYDLAAECYEQAAELAAKDQHTSGEALVNGLAADFYLTRGMKTIARSYAENARFIYMRWGATAKVNQIERQYSGLLQMTNPERSPAKSVTIHGATTQKTTTFTNSLDFDSVVKAAQGISKEIVLQKLEETLIRTVIENAGADKGVLIMEEQGQLRIEAGCLYDGGKFLSLTSTSLKESSDVSPAIVRLVARSREPIVLGNATSSDSFVTDSYLKNKKPKSILCMPIEHSGSLVAVLYLENKQTEDVFTRERLHVLQVLASQAAISIRNAKLYHELAASKELLQEALHKAEESDRIKTTFLSRTSHELRTPLNPIINIPEWVKEGFASVTGAYCSHCKQEFELEPNDDIAEIDTCPECGSLGTIEGKDVFSYNRSPESIISKMDMIQESGTRLLSIVDDILNFSNLQLGNSSLNKIEVNLDLLLKDVRNDLETLASNHGVTIALANESHEPTAIIDDEKIKQVLAILGKNAIQASAKESEIILRAERENRHLLFSVQDFGTGIDETDKSIIFESFRQAEEGHTRNRGGTGLGLAIAKNIVDLHCGEIWLESVTGKGSTFFVKLPLDESVF